MEIIARRIGDRGAPAFVVEAVAKLLDEQLNRPEYLIEDELLERFLAKIAESASFRRLVSDASTALPVEVRLLGGNLGSLGRATLRGALDKLSTTFDDPDAGTGIFDVFETLRMAMQPDCVSVADKLLGHLQPDDVIVALMMDIPSESEPARDRRNFQAQFEGTVEAALQRPGRVLPFIAVNTRRRSHFSLMREAIERHGFAGVKLYPSLGFEVDTDAMRRVYAYCQDRDLPIVMHCTMGGFYRSEMSRQFSDPSLWEDILPDFPLLRICFAHCGGWAGLAGASGVEPGSWTEAVVKLMKAHPNVRADLSNHVEMMRGGDAEARYLSTLKGLLADPATADRILFGTDAWLVRLAMTDAHFWHYFESKLTPPEFRKIAEENPRVFFGLPDESTGEGMRPNIQRHVAYLVSHRDRVGAEPAAWLRAVTPGVTFVVRRASPSWTPNNQAHFYTYRYLRELMTPGYQALGFERSGALRMRQLTYWQKEHESAAVFAQRCEANARKLASFCVVNGATYEGTYTDTAAVERLIELFENGELTVAEAAGTVDAVFRFQMESTQ